MRYAVKAIERTGYPGFRRSGFLFASNQATEIDSAVIGEARMAAILAEPMLVVEPLEAAELKPAPFVIVEPKKPAKKRKKKVSHA